MIEYYVILVVCNTRIDESIAYNSLKKDAKCTKNKVTFIIADNSTSEKIKSANRIYLNNDMYIDMQGNKGLSCAYSKAISHIKKEPENWVITSDQDTTFPDHFFNVLDRTIENGNGKVYAPRVLNANSQMSPFYLKYDYKAKIARAINSGLAIRSDIFTKVKYNEDLFLDFVDFDLINTLLRFNIRIQHLDVELYQDFSGTDFSDKHASLKRFKLYLSDAEKYYGTWKHSAFSKRFYVVKRAINLSFHFKTISFIKLVVEHS